jgi:aspartyl-tRNA(Asn)/glutamyl-tRNA(Gln) amidotransferase subunit A
LVMTAAPPTAPPAIEAVGKFAIFERPMLTMPFNVTGTPAMSICCGYMSAGLPLAFQLAGKPFDEAAVLKVAHAYERATPWRSVRPKLAS